MVNFWRFLRAVLSESRVQHISDLHSKFALGRIMCGSMVDIQSAAAENRRGKRERRKKKQQEENGMACPIGQP